MPLIGLGIAAGVAAGLLLLYSGFLIAAVASMGIGLLLYVLTKQWRWAHFFIFVLPLTCAGVPTGAFLAIWLLKVTGLDDSLLVIPTLISGNFIGPILGFAMGTAVVVLLSNRRFANRKADR